MSKKSKSKNKNSNRLVKARRDNSIPIAKHSLHRRSLSIIQDLRTLPHRSSYSVLLNSNAAPVPVRRFVRPDFSVVSSIPKNALLCARRKIRKEVLFSQGRGGSRVSKPKFGRNSHLRCS